MKVNCSPVSLDHANYTIMQLFSVDTFVAIIAYISNGVPQKNIIKWALFV